ncbi:MAG: hypothetical protein AAGE52_37460 [Myxococcota bacterium]
MLKRFGGCFWASLFLTSTAFGQSDAPATDEPATDEPPAADEQTQAAPEEDDDPRQLRTEGIDEGAARSRFRVGQTLYEEGRFAEAAREFESSYELSQRASLLFNAYLAYRDAGDLSEATRVLGRYIEAAPDVEDIETLRRRHAAMRETVDRQQTQAAEEEAERQRLEEERERLAREAEEQRRRAEAAEGNPLNPAGFAVGGVGVAMLAGALVTGLIARGRVSDIEDNCPDDRCVLGFDLDSERADADRMIRTSDVLLFAGIATTAVGIGLLFVGRGDDEDEEAPQATFGCGPQGCHAEMTMEF